MKSQSEVAAGVVLIVAPLGKDAALASGVLEQAGIPAKICGSLREAGEASGSRTNAIVIAEEALAPADLSFLLARLQQQPPWSDLPLIVLTSARDEANRRALEVFGHDANVTFLERPLGTVTLVTAIRAALRARRRQYQIRDLLEQREAALTSISDAFAAFDRDWRYIYVNDMAAKYAGRTRDEMIGRIIWEIYPQAIGGNFYKYAHRALESRQPQTFEQYYPQWQCWLETRIYPATDGVVVFRANINERKKQEELFAAADRRLQDNEALLRLALEAADAGTYDFYPLTGELRWSERTRALYALPKDAEVTYEAFARAVHPEDLGRVEAALEAALDPAGERRLSVEYRVIGISDGVERWLSKKGRPLFNKEGVAERLIGTVLDTTERKNAEIVLEQAKSAAEAANRSKDQFLAMLSHELRTPLTPVLMTVAALQRDPSVSDTLRADLEVIHRNIELEALLIDDLLDLTRITHGKLDLHNDAVDIHSQIAHALAISSTDIGAKQLNVTCNLDAPEHHSWADGARLQQVFWNIIKNAVKFTPPRGQIAISTRNDASHCIVVEICDTGMGIDPEVMPKIFNAFEQGRRTVTTKFGGLGLGLAISKSIIDMHHGTLIAKSDGVGTGATFCITLQAMETSLLDGPAYPVEQAAPVSGAHVLLVEDHADTARVLRRILENAGYQVGTANTIAAARRLANEQQFDLVISDLGLPDGTGVELMRELRDSKGLSGIALSGFGSDDDIAASRAAGFSDHLIKPVDWNRLREAVDRLVAARADELSPA